MTTGSLDERVLAADGAKLQYSLRRTLRRRTVGIFIEPDGRLVVLAPALSDTTVIEAILRRRLSWIRRQRLVLESLPAPLAPRQWVRGETHRYLGRQYRLKLVRRSDASVRLAGAFFVVGVLDPADTRLVRRLMETWYRQHAAALLRERVRRILTSTTWLDVEPPPITIRTLRRRWGSTTRSGRVAFNLDLVKLPLGCIDYVVAHELVHLRIPNHSPAFWKMLGRVMPDWKKWRERLARAEV